MGIRINYSKRRASNKLLPVNASSSFDMSPRNRILTTIEVLKILFIKTGISFRDDVFVYKPEAATFVYTGEPMYRIVDPEVDSIKLDWRFVTATEDQVEGSCGQSNYAGETGKQPQTRMAEHAAAVRRNDASSQVAAHSTGPRHTFKFDEAEILARGDNRVSRELLESWFTGPQSINKCNDLPIQYSVLRLRLGGVIGHAGGAQVNTLPNIRVSASDGRAIITPASNARDGIAAINDANVGHHTTCNDP
ncbi:hypothetical protein SprV_0501828100 [Sparganum proliferum]